MTKLKVIVAMHLDTYIIAVKRELRGSEPLDWQEQIGQSEGIHVILTDGVSPRMRVRAKDEAIQRLRSKWDALCHIEKQIEHKPHSVLGF